MAWSGFGQTHLVRKQAGVQESSGPASGRTQPARYQFPTFRLGCLLPQTARIILSKTSPGLIFFLADCVRFGPDRSGPEASRCARITGPLSVQSFRSDPDRKWIGTGMCTGQLVTLVTPRHECWLRTVHGYMTITTNNNNNKTQTPSPPTNATTKHRHNHHHHYQEQKTDTITTSNSNNNNKALAPSPLTTTTTKHWHHHH